MRKLSKCEGSPLPDPYSFRYQSQGYDFGRLVLQVASPLGLGKEIVTCRGRYSGLNLHTSLKHIAVYGLLFQ